MKRSLYVSAPLLASTALVILTTGCRRPQMQRCVDEQNRVVAVSFCQVNGQQTQQQPVTGGGYGGGGGGYIYVPHYRYYYGGIGNYSPGTIVSGGSYSPSAGAHYSTGTSRGGFGSSHGGGGGGE